MSPSRPYALPRLSLLSAWLLVSLLCFGACSESEPLAEIRAMQQAGNFQGSLEPLRELLDERPSDPETLFLYGRALTLTGQATQGAWALEKAMEDPEWRVPAGTQLARGALQSWNFPAAIENAGRVLEAEPENVAALLIRAEGRAYARQNLEEVLADADRILQLEPTQHAAFKPRILALLALDRIDEAARAIDELGKRLVTDEDSDLAGWHCATKAVFEEERGNAEQAEKLWPDCLERFPGDPSVVSNAVEFYDGRNARDRSLEILRAALDAAPTANGFRSALVDRLRVAGDTQEAERLLREATESEDSYEAVQAWIDLAEHHQALGQPAAGVEAVDRAIELARAGRGGVIPQLLFEQADALVLAGEFERALAVAEQTTVPAHRRLIRARVAQERGQPAQALRHYDEAFRLWPDNPDARFMAALAAEAAGDLDRAIEEYRYVIRLAPGDLESRMRLARLHLAEGQPALAMAILGTHNQPLDLEAQLLSLRVLAELGEAQLVNAALERLKTSGTAALARALAGVAEGQRARSGPEEALRRLREAKRIRLADPEAAPALRVFVQLSHEAGKLPQALATVRGALAEHPNVAALHEILGLALELGGAPPPEVRAAYARAVELDPESARALQGLARLALENGAGEALAFFDRAIAADPSDSDAKRGAAKALVRAGRHAEAEARLEEALLKHPYEGTLAADLAELRLARDPASAETLALARRAARFGGGPAAWDLVSHIHAGRGDAEKASMAAERARSLRERRAPGVRDAGRVLSPRGAIQ